MLVVKTNWVEFVRNRLSEQGASAETLTIIDGFITISEMNEDAFNEDEECYLEKCLCIKSDVEGISEEEAFREGYWRFYSENLFAEQFLGFLNNYSDICDIMELFDDEDILIVVEDSGRLREFRPKEIESRMKVAKAMHSHIVDCLDSLEAKYIWLDNLEDKNYTIGDVDILSKRDYSLKLEAYAWDDSEWNCLHRMFSRLTTKYN